MSKIPSAAAKQAVGLRKERVTVFAGNMGDECRQDMLLQGCGAK